MDLLTKLLEHHIWLVGEIVDRAERLPAERLDAPIEVSVEGLDDDPTLRSLLSRLVGQMDMWNAAMESRAYDFAIERDESLRSIRARLDTAGPVFLAHAREVIDGRRLDETFVDAICEPAQVFTYGGMLGPRPDVRGAPADARDRRAPLRRDHRPRPRRPDALDRGGGGLAAFPARSRDRATSSRSRYRECGRRRKGSAAHLRGGMQ